MVPPEEKPAEQQSTSAEIRTEMLDELCLRKGDFIALVQRYRDQYAFSVRDVHCEAPAMEGFGVDFSHALSTVTQLLDELTRRS